MINARFITEDDYFIIADAISKDEHHKDTTNADFFYELGTLTIAYEDEEGPVLFLRGAGLSEVIMRLDIQYINNNDFRRNRKVMMTCFDEFAQSCKNAGWEKLAFFSASPLLIKFCVKHFGFVETDGLLVKQL